MSDYQLVSDYKHIKKYKESFNILAKSIFGIDFSPWYEQGGWNDKYICYSYIDGDQVIANASINKMTIILNQKEYNAIQIGTVMTHPDYRMQGLSRKLIDHIIAKYEQEYDFIYLFANDSALDFYPKFGFERMQESSFSINASNLRNQTSKTFSVRPLSMNSSVDLIMIKKFAEGKVPVSTILSVVNNEHQLLFYFILPFHDSFYYIEEADVVVIFKHEGHQLHIFDMISTTSLDIEAILNSIISPETEIIHFYFTPDYALEHMETELIPQSEDTLFVRPLLKELPKHFMFPITSHA
ncbi:GNAT family N-acetyltransferase [Paenibacillus sp. FSL K6-3166]|uniref:GNAT family N-acetyltransferase n=1 Tax=unclassified Paenibacillus TaxID=185978 RepID=UPI000BA09C62|nr:GNAT family N-acetyltransferase [Paenibacillus sp. VTT E-133291]OZQ82847.1 GNAT family N-acetyltransferase [Paenibacillus sp. VTT E-133291]